uniref:Uncharacterized protein n=1 Tax=Rhizophora mucronata TaxID=61149 RepID=A0A2P2R3J5_RHIMU
MIILNAPHNLERVPSLQLSKDPAETHNSYGSITRSIANMPNPLICQVMPLLSCNSPQNKGSTNITTFRKLNSLK